MFFSHWDYIKKANVTSQRSQGGGGGGEGVLFYALVKFPLVEIWSIFYYLDVLPEIYLGKAIVMTETCHFLIDKKTV